MRLLFETTMERRRKRASQCRFRALSRRRRASRPCRIVLPEGQEDGVGGVGVRAVEPGARARQRGSDARSWPGATAHSRYPPTALKHDPKLSRSRAARTFFSRTAKLAVW